VCLRGSANPHSGTCAHVHVRYREPLPCERAACCMRMRVGAVVTSCCLPLYFSYVIPPNPPLHHHRREHPTPARSSRRAGLKPVPISHMFSDGVRCSCEQNNTSTLVQTDGCLCKANALVYSGTNHELIARLVNANVHSYASRAVRVRRWLDV